MTQDEIIEMARQAGYLDLSLTDRGMELKELKAFAKLVAEREREKLKNIAFFDRWYREMNAAVLAEREACAKVVLTIANKDAGNPYKQALRIGAEAIRARGQQ